MWKIYVHRDAPPNPIVIVDGDREEDVSEYRTSKTYTVEDRDRGLYLLHGNQVTNMRVAAHHFTEERAAIAACDAVLRHGI